MTAPQLEHHLDRWAFWLSRTEELQDEYDRRLAAHAERFPHLSEETIGVDFDKGYFGRLIAAREQWAHRRARTHGQAVLILMARPDDGLTEA